MRYRRLRRFRRKRRWSVRTANEDRLVVAASTVDAVGIIADVGKAEPAAVGAAAVAVANELVFARLEN